jgi:hypothetical protein
MICARTSVIATTPTKVPRPKKEETYLLQYILKIMNEYIPGLPATMTCFVGFFSLPKEAPGKYLDADRNHDILHPPLLIIHEFFSLSHIAL